jgi:hypothetical protein
MVPDVARLAETGSRNVGTARSGNSPQKLQAGMRIRPNCRPDRNSRTARLKVWEFWRFIAREALGEKCQDVPAPQVHGVGPAGSIYAVHLRDRLGDIETDSRNRLQR